MSMESPHKTWKPNMCVICSTNPTWIETLFWGDIFLVPMRKAAYKSHEMI